jgi:hypothetical protein
MPVVYWLLHIALIAAAKMVNNRQLTGSASIHYTRLVLSATLILTQVYLHSVGLIYVYRGSPNRR